MIHLDERHWLADDAAASYLRMLAAGCPAGITSAGRTRAEQQRLRDLYLAGKGNFALPPGNSQHELGLALDLPEPARSWVRKNGAEYGWRKDVNPAENWHMEYVSTNDKHKDEPVEITLSDKDVARIAFAILGYKNPKVSNGDVDVYGLLRRTNANAEEAAANTRKASK